MPAPDDCGRCRSPHHEPAAAAAGTVAGRCPALCLWLIWVSPEYAVVPFHLIWIGFALAYGFEAWPLGRTALLLGVAAVLPGIVMVHRAADGEMSWLETTEIPLMLLLSALVVWHVQRREAALRKVVVLAEREAATAAQRVRLGRMTSHEMRTPLTIATGYVHLLLGMEDRPEHRTDLEIINDELARATRAGDRLLRMIQMQDRLPRPLVDVDDLLEETAQRWAAVAASQLGRRERDRGPPAVARAVPGLPRHPDRELAALHRGRGHRAAAGRALGRQGGPRGRGLRVRPRPRGSSPHQRRRPLETAPPARPAGPGCSLPDGARDRARPGDRRGPGREGGSPVAPAKGARWSC